MFINPTNIATIKARAQAGGTHNDTYRVLKDWCNAKWNLPIYPDQYGADFSGYEPYDYGFLRFALIYALGTLPGESYAHTYKEYGAKAVAIINNIVANGRYPYIRFLATAYDWVYNLAEADGGFSAANKTAFVNHLKSYVGSYCAITAPQYGYAHLGEAACLYSGLAFYGDGVNDATATSYLTWVESTWLPHARAISHVAGSGGGNFAGQCYSHVAYLDMAISFYALITATNLTIANTYDTYPYANTLPSWYVYGLRPGPIGQWAYFDPANDVATLNISNDCGNYGKTWRKSIHDANLKLFAMADIAKQDGRTTDSQVFTWFMTTKLGITKVDASMDLIVQDRTISAVDPNTAVWPLVKPFGWNTSTGVIDTYLTQLKAGIGEVFMKSSWDSSATSTATFAWFKAFPFYYFGHGHNDSLNFSIGKGEQLINPNSGRYYTHYEGYYFDNPSQSTVGYPHHWKYYRRTQSTNSILIFDPAEIIRMPLAEGADAYYFRDGGQRDLGSFNTSWGNSWINWSNLSTDYADWGGLTKYENGTNYTYISADATKGYNSIVGGVKHTNDWQGVINPKTRLVQRDFVYSKSSDGASDYFVVFDRVNSTNASFKKAIRLHSGKEFVFLNGTPTLTYGDGSSGLWEYANADSIRLVGTHGKMFIKSLLPASSKIYKYGGGYVTTTLSGSGQVINATDGDFREAKIPEILVASSAGLPDKPIVVIDSEAFMCDGKATGKLTNCIRGTRYFKNNFPVAHNGRATVKQGYFFMYKESDGSNWNWINHPFNYGDPEADTMQAGFYDENSKWGIQIENTVNELNTNFLIVYFPTIRGTSMPTTTLITPSVGSMYGALINDAVNPRIVMFAPTTDLVSDVTYRATYSDSLTGRHLITGLYPNAKYAIYKNGVRVDAKTTSSQGVIYFESKGGQSFQIEKTKEREKADRNPLTSSEKLIYFN